MASHMTLKEAKETLQALYKAKRDIINGQAASYRVGSREVVLLSLEQVNAEIRRHEGLLDTLNNKRSGKMVKTVVFVD